MWPHKSPEQTHLSEGELPHPFLLELSNHLVRFTSQRRLGSTSQLVHSVWRSKEVFLILQCWTQEQLYSKNWHHSQTLLNPTENFPDHGCDCSTTTTRTNGLPDRPVWCLLWLWHLWVFLPSWEIWLRQDLKHFVFIHVSVVPVIQAAMASGASHASVAPLRVTWMSAAYGAQAWRCAASTGLNTTSK